MDEAMDNMNDDVDLGDMTEQVVKEYYIRPISLSLIWNSRQLEM